MAKTRTTKFQTYPQLYQFGGLNLPFLDYYTDLNKQWGNFWRGGDYFKQPEIPPTGMYGDPTAKLHNTITANNTASGRFKTAKEAYSKHYTGDTWDDDAHNFYYKQDWEARNPNATQTDKDRFDQYASFEKTADNLVGPNYTEALLNAGINPGDYDSWFKGRKTYSDKAGQQFNAAPGVRKHYEQTQKELANAINNTAGGIFSGLNYMNAYTPPEKINMQQGSKGVMYSQYGTIVPSDPPNNPYKDFIKGPGTMYSPMMKEFGGVKIPTSRWTHFPSGDHAVSALDSLLFSGRSKYYHNDTKVRDALQTYSGGDYSSHKLAEKTLGSLNPEERLQLVADIIKREVTAESYKTNYAGAIASRRIGPSTMKLQVTSRQDGGNVNVTGYTPGTPTMDNSMNEIPSGNITMEQTPIPLLAIGKGGSDNGLLKILQPNSKGYNFKSKSTIEMPLEQQQPRQRLMMAQKGIGIPEQEGGLPTTERRAPISIFKSLRAKGYLQEYDEDSFNKLSAEEQDMLFKKAAADFNSKQAPPQGEVIQEIRRPLATQLDSSIMVPNQMSFEDAFAQARSQGLQQFEFNGNLFTTKIDPNAKASSGRANTMQVINTSQAGLARDLIGNRQFGGLASMVQDAMAQYGKYINYNPLHAQFGTNVSEDQWISQILDYETNNGSAGGTGLTNYGIKKDKWAPKYSYLNKNTINKKDAIRFIKEEYLSKVKNYPPEIQKRLVDYAYNTGRSIEDLLLFADGKISLDDINSSNVYTDKWKDNKSEIEKNLKNPEFVSKLNNARDQVAKTTKQINGQPNPAYKNTWYDRIRMFDPVKTSYNENNKISNINANTTSSNMSSIDDRYNESIGYNQQVVQPAVQQSLQQQVSQPISQNKSSANSNAFGITSGLQQVFQNMADKTSNNLGYIVPVPVPGTDKPATPEDRAAFMQKFTPNTNPYGNMSEQQAAYLNGISGGDYINATPEFNAKMLQGFNSASPQTQGGQLNIPMLPTINPSIVEPMSGLGFNRDKLQAKLRVNATGNMTPFEVTINNSNSVVSKKGDPYEYKVVNGIWQARKRGSKNWITLRDHNMIEAVSNYFTDQTDLEMDEYSLKKSYNKSKYQYGGYIPKFQYGGSVNDQHAVPIFSSHLEEFGLTELQTEKDEVAFMPDGSIVDVKAKKLHKHQDKNNVSDIMQSGTYIFSNDPKMKFGIKSKIGGVELGDMKLGKSVFKYKENEVTPGPEDIMLKDMFFNGSKKELTTAEIAKNVKKNLPIVDMKNDYFADRAIAENKDQRKEYLSILKAFNEYKKPKPTSVPKAQYGMPIQNTQNGLDGVMGYGDKQMDPFKRADNNLISMWKMPQPSIPSIPKMYNNGGYIPHAQFGWLGDAIDAIGGWSRKAERRQREKNEFLRREAQGYRDNLQRGVDTAGGIGVGTNLATYAAALNVPLQKYDDQSEQMSLYNAAANRAAQRLEASKYTASQGIGGASSLARYSNPTNYGDYLSKVQSQSDGNISKLNQAIADLDMQRANANVGFISNRNAGRNQSLNARDTQLYNANIQGIGNVGRSAQEATFNTADTKYRLGNEKMAYDAYLTDKAEAAKQAKQQQIRGYTNEIGQLGLTYATGGFGGSKLFDKGNSSQAGQPSFTGFNPASFSGPNFQNPAQMSPANQQFNSNYDGRFTTYNTIDSGGLVDRSGTMLNINSKTGVPWYINPATGRPWGE